jgi:1-acyl-sn-glycerol-3-phosphate acyltransferase
MKRDQVEDYIYRPWVRFFAWLMKWAIGLKHEISGKENLELLNQGSPFIIACKHQSLWETFIFPIFIKRFVIVLKKELISVPFFGYYLSRLNSIPLDRSQGLTAIKQLLRKGQESSNAGYHILIYPEGTRSYPGEMPELNPGVAALYDRLKIPVIPVSLNSGEFWGRRTLFKKPGTINIYFRQPIQPGLDKSTFLARLHHDLNAPSED